jgi:hypothetical protein
MLVRYLRFLRQARGLRRKLFRGKMPQWAKDIVKLVKYVNFVPLVTTIIYLLAVPQHFFARLPTVIAGKK